MSHPEVQLREYFEAGVERITVDDVLIRAAVRATEPVRRPPAEFRPLRAAATAFALTIVAIGGLFVGLDLIDSARDFGRGGISPLTAPLGGFGAWPIALVGAGGVVGLTSILLRRHHGKVETMDTLERQPVEEHGVDPLTRRTRQLSTTIAVLLVALLALGAWMIFGTRPLSDNAAPDEIVQLMEDYNAAWNSFDADALATLTTDDYGVHAYPIIGSTGLDTGIPGLRTLLPSFERSAWHVTSDGPFYALNEGNLWFVSSEGALLEGDFYRGGSAVSVGIWLVVDQNGTLLVRDHYMYGAP